MGGSHPWQGRVEVYYDGKWGTVCDDFWDNFDAQVVCRQLDYPTTEVKSFSDATYGEGFGDIWLDNVACSGTESFLSACAHGGWGEHNCAHAEDAGVNCYCKSLTLTLTLFFTIFPFSSISFETDTIKRGGSLRNRTRNPSHTIH